MKKYEKYKNSGIEWIGEIPSHWEVKKLKYIVSLNDETLSEKTDEEVLIEYIEIGDLKNGNVNSTEYYFVNAPSRARRIVRSGDVIVSTVRTYLKAIAQISDDKDGFIASTGFAVLRTKAIDSRFLGYYSHSPFFINNTIANSVGVTYPAINALNILDFLIQIPTPEEQSAIASYLDRKTAEIDELIADKKRLLELYEEEKNAIINQAVTKGINPNAPMKDSGIEWLGEIPEHWEVKRLKYVANLKSGNNIVSEQIKESGEYPVFGGNGLRGYFSDYTHEGHNILIGRQGAYCGNIKFGMGKFWASEHAIVLTEIIKYEVIYLGELLSSMNLNQYSVSAAQPGLSVDTIKNLLIPFPPIEEQHSIVQYIETETARINQKVATTEKLIELLTEYRQALISEVVTGKIKVTE